MIVALIDSGLGMLPTSAWLRKLRPDLDLLLLLDPDGAPWGPRSEEWVIARVVATAEDAVRRGAEVIVLPCNTASVTALDDVRRRFPTIPVIGTVPAIKPAAAACSSVAIWATAVTTASRYQAKLIEDFGNGADVVGIACHGLVDAIERGDLDAAKVAIAAAAERTPDHVEAVVLGCTHYPLVQNQIADALPAGVRLFDSAPAVAAQTVRRIEALNRPATGAGSVQVLLSGRQGELPPAAAAFGVAREFVAQ